MLASNNTMLLAMLRLSKKSINNVGRGTSTQAKSARMTKILDAVLPDLPRSSVEYKRRFHREALDSLTFKSVAGFKLDAL